MIKIIKITAIWCPACLVMNKVWNKINKENINIINLDYDIDYEEVKKYNPGKILPVFIFIEDDIEIKRVVGEVSEKKLSDIIEELHI